MAIAYHNKAEIEYSTQSIFCIQLFEYFGVLLRMSVDFQQAHSRNHTTNVIICV